MSVLSYARFMLGLTALSLPILSNATDSANSIFTKADATTFFATDSKNLETSLDTDTETLAAEEKKFSVRPLCIALLMPSDNSPFLAAAKIVENGILAANRVENNHKVTILRIESQRQLTIDEQIDAAVYAGADVVIGPLQKDLVEDLAKKHDLTIPTVALNVSESDATASNKLLMLSISMEDEARQLAHKAIAGLVPTEQGERPKVIILKSEDSWTNKISQAYEEVLKENQIEYVVETVTIDSLTDLKGKLEPSLTPEAEEYFKLRYEELEKIEDEKKLKLLKRQIHNELRTYVAESEPPYQSALLAMDATMASLVRSRLHVRMRVWATSSTNPGDTSTSPTAKALAYDLNELRFIETPLVLNYDANSFSMKFGMEIPYTLPAKRLFALGADAYTLANIWASGKTRFEIIGEIGNLSIDRTVTPKVQRTPVTAIIERGLIIHPAPELPFVPLPEQTSATPLNVETVNETESLIPPLSSQEIPSLNTDATVVNQDSVNITPVIVPSSTSTDSKNYTLPTYR